MNQDQQTKLELWAARELQALPPRRAPAELARRVRQAIEARQYGMATQRAVPWSPAARFAAAAVCCVSLVAFFWFAATTPLFSNFQASTQGLFASLSDAAGGAMAIGNATLLFLRKIGQPALLAALLVFGALGAFCAGVGTVCFRFVITEKEI